MIVYLQPCKDMIDSVDGEPIMLHVRRGDPNLTDPRGFKWSYTQCGSHASCATHRIL